MNLTQLKYFKAICTYKSVSQASQYLHISQPSLSSAIKELESEFKISLFRRHHRGMTLTPEGETLLKLSEELLKKAEQTEKIMNEFSNQKKKLRLGVPPMIGSLILPDVYKNFIAQNPLIIPEITEGGTQNLISLLDDDTLDMIFIPHKQPIEQCYSSIKAKNLEIVCCVSENNPLSELKSVGAEDLKNVPLVLFKNSFFQTEEIKKWFSVSKIEPSILLQTDQLSTIQTLISNDVAAGFLFSELISSHPNLIPIPLKEKFLIDVSLVWRKSSRISNEMKKLISFIKSN